MSLSTSRLSRWHRDGLDLRSGSDQARDSDGLQDQVRRATDAAIVASRSAHDRLDGHRHRVQVRVMLLGVLGAAALAGLSALIVLPSIDHSLALGAAGLCSTAGAFAGAMLSRLAWRGDSAAESAAAAVAADNALETQAKALSKLALLLRDEPATTAQFILERVIADVAHASQAARDREAGIRGSAQVQGRRHERIVPRQTRVQVTVADGRILNARIVDVSQSGVALEGNFPGCGVGQRLNVGSQRARVVRVLPRGLACEFLETIPAATLTPDIVL